MPENTSYTTRQVAEMWNVCESTVKRWADTGLLGCYRTPGGHRRFLPEHLFDFQQKRGFEATGLLSSPAWEEPELEVWLNQKNFARVGERIFELCAQNQIAPARQLLERIYLRGTLLPEMYDTILIPVFRKAGKIAVSGRGGEGRALLARNNLEEALHSFFPHIARRSRNEKIGLCASTCRGTRCEVNAATRILELEGWETLNLGENVTFAAMVDLVENEPVNLVCLVSPEVTDLEEKEQGFSSLLTSVNKYRIPLALTGNMARPCPAQPPSTCLNDYRSLQDYVSHLVH